VTDGPIQIRRRRRDPFAAVPARLARDPEISDKAKVLWAVLDTYADYTDRDCWPTVATLAKACGDCHRATVARAQKELVRAGWLEVASGKETGMANTYTLLDGPAPGGQGVLHGCDTPRAPTRDPGGAPAREGGSAPTRDRTRTSKREPDNEIAAQAPRATDDPVKAHAHRLTVLAFEQPVKPNLREGGKGAFPAAMALLEAQLRAGSTVQALERAIVAGVEVWTKAGLQTAVAHAAPAKRGAGRRDSDPRSTRQIAADVLGRERRRA
jgi:hypothetical protein